MTALLFVIILLLIMVDQLLKIIMQGWLMYEPTYKIIDGVLGFTYLENRGAAFGILQNMRWVFILLTGVVILFLIYLLIAKKLKSQWMMAGAVLIVAGGIGNLIDRIFRGYVIDYIEPLFINFAVFNFADMLITVGAGIVIVKLLVDIIQEQRQAKLKKQDCPSVEAEE